MAWIRTATGSTAAEFDTRMDRIIAEEVANGADFVRLEWLKTPGEDGSFSALAHFERVDFAALAHGDHAETPTDEMPRPRVIEVRTSRGEREILYAYRGQAGTDQVHLGLVTDIQEIGTVYGPVT